MDSNETKFSFWIKEETRNKDLQIYRKKGKCTHLGTDQYILATGKLHFAKFNKEHCGKFLRLLAKWYYHYRSDLGLEVLFPDIDKLRMLQVALRNGGVSEYMDSLGRDRPGGNPVSVESAIDIFSRAFLDEAILRDFFIQIDDLVG